ncbi:BamA/TamA family outer membrane protein [Mucilaginibacter pallidiroseus]|uniref:BamA/TamA family outer membrane protein n=2 Tax=Mucilaginibacter pallidiroseus TaxID=2599295 RepID=A0A563U1Q8_9SPHI|nr:BamA/TamA family outer membrane protein [Mucilaginibacter pallidiroseus]
MFNKYFVIIILSTISILAVPEFLSAQTGNTIFPDSVTVSIRPRYDSAGSFHRWFFGRNYREEWAAPVKLPLIRISAFAGGLKPVKEGGGLQSTSLRLTDAGGQGWVIRSVEKKPDKILPEQLRQTFVLDWFDDAMSSQHPYGALVIPPLAEAAGVPHTNPVIGVVVNDPALGEYNKKFEHMVVLLEEREPEGKSENTVKMQSKVLADHDYRIDGKSFLKARMLDLLAGDWDRHEEQWRWVLSNSGKIKLYTGIPRDRDQVFHVQEGIGPSIASVSWINPLLDDFDGSIPRPKYSLAKTRFIQPYPDFQFSYEDWMRAAREFVKAENDTVLFNALKRLPPEIYGIRHAELYDKLKKRRDHIPGAMDSYYRFVNRIVDLRLSDKGERISVTDAGDGRMRVRVEAMNSKGTVTSELLNMIYDPQITREIRIYAQGGSDQVSIDIKYSPIRLRLIGQDGNKEYVIHESFNTVGIYSKPDSIRLTGKKTAYRAHLSADTSNTQFVQNNPYNVWMPLAMAAGNKDDGLLIGAGFRYTGQNGFRKLPYATMQQLVVTHSFATSAFRVNYHGEWVQVVGKTDFMMDAVVNAPNNTQNFFGRGNQTPLMKFPGYRTFYRTRYDTYRFEPALRWWFGKSTSLSAGPGFEFYHMNSAENAGRFIGLSPAATNSYDSTTTGRDKAHLGVSMLFKTDQRDQRLLPSRGFYFELNIRAYKGLNSYSRSFLQIRPELTWYQRLDHAGALIISDRAGGGITAGSPAFYQSLFLGGQGNLLGYLQNRFAGDHMAYNNFQARLRLFNVASYIMPGELGLIGFNDTGRVWVKGEDSEKWHNGAGGGIYFAPAGLTLVQVLAGHSSEGWYPYISLNLRL